MVDYTLPTAGQLDWDDEIAAVFAAFDDAAVPGGGASGAVLTKASADDYDMAWATPSAGHVIKDEGSAVTVRANLDFVGAGVAVADDSGNAATRVTVAPIIGVSVWSGTGGTGTYSEPPTVQSGGVVLFISSTDVDAPAPATSNITGSPSLLANWLWVSVS